MRTVGISINITQSDFSVWANGMRQNIFFLARTLRNSGRFRVVLVDYGWTPRVPLDAGLPWDQGLYPTVRYEDIKDELDLLVMVGVELSAPQGHYLRGRGCKVVNYICGSRYIMEMQDILFMGGKGRRGDESFVHEFWMLPQMTNTCRHYLETLYKTPVREVPCVWGPEFIEKASADLPNQGRCRPVPGPKRVACFEPNLDVVKFCMYDLLIAEKAHEASPGLIRHLYVTNAAELKKSERFVSLATKLSLVKEGLATFEGRFRLPSFLSQYVDIVLAHQWENAFNYAYLDALHLRYPLVHNATLIREAGYYYEGFDAAQGAARLIEAAETHHLHAEEYAARCEAVVWRHSHDNPANVAAYERAALALLGAG